MSEQIRTMFSSISARYDFMNDLLSIGIHRRWRKHLINTIESSDCFSILDLATGTGDLAFAFEKEYPSASVIGADFCQGMLDIAVKKRYRRSSNVQFKLEDAMNLSFNDSTFDICSISFGIRNVDKPEKAIREMARVCKSSGKVLVLEFGQPKGLFKWVYDLYSRFIMPLLGRLFTGSKPAYSYLQASAAKFPCREQFIGIMEKTGMFQKTEYRTLTFGIAYIYIGIVK